MAFDAAEYRKFRIALLGYLEAFGPTSYAQVRAMLRDTTPCIASNSSPQFLRQLLMDKQIYPNGLGEYALTPATSEEIKRNGLR